MADERRGRRVHERWAHLRFSVIDQLLAAPPAKGELKAAIVVASARVAARLTALVTLSIAKPVGFHIQKRVQCLLDRAPHDTVQMTLDPLVVDPDHVVEHSRNRSILVRHGGSFFGSLADLAIAMRPCVGAASRHSIVRRILYVIVVSRTAQDQDVFRCSHPMSAPPQLNRPWHVKIVRRRPPSSATTRCALSEYGRYGPPSATAAWLIMVGRNAGIYAVRKSGRLAPLPPDEVISDTSDVERTTVDTLDASDYRNDIMRLLFICCLIAVTSYR